MERRIDHPQSRLVNGLAVAGLLGLFAWQVWMTLGLFGAGDPWNTLLDDRPVVSGFHPLHQYHGYLGASSLSYSGRFCCYDPAFQAGYPKTPIFDSGSRPAELFAFLGGGDFSPAAYKIGLAVSVLLVPLFLVVAARGAGLGWAATFLAVAFGLMVWWGRPARRALEAGEFDLLLAGLIILAHLGMLIRFDRRPGFAPWLGMFLTAVLGWFAHPLLFPMMLPLFLFYYLGAGVRHRALAWHISLALAQLGAAGVNLVWLYDWLMHWWIRSPLPPSLETLPHRTLRTVWQSPFWGQRPDRAFAVLLIVSGLLGLIAFLRTRQRSTARLLGLGGTMFFALAVLGISWEPLGRLGTSVLLIPALWFAAVSAAYGWAETARAVGRRVPGFWPRAAVTVAPAVALLAVYHEDLTAWAVRWTTPTELEVGLGPERAALVEMLREHTGPEARILWEDKSGRKDASHWTALLPLLTNRHYIGGLDPSGQIEHSHTGFIRYHLARTPVSQISDGTLEDYCRRYNIGWAVLWSDPAVQLFRRWQSGAREIGTVHDGGTGYLFQVLRDRPSMALVGKAEVVHADEKFLALRDVVPVKGRVVLSLHYQSGMQASPSRVRVEPEPDPIDSIPLLRLRVDSPVSHVTIHWEQP